MKSTLFFPHLPKCGGTSIEKFIQSSGINAFYDYDHPPSHRKFFRDLSERRNKEFSQLNFNVFDIVYGHYPTKRYNHKSNVVLLLRHPVDRAISHFNYWKYVMPKSNLIGLAKEPLVQLIKDGDCDFVTFLKNAKIDTFFLRYLDELDLRDVREVFFTDQMHKLFDYLSDYFDLKLPHHNLRERENTIKKESVPENDLKFAYNFLKDEIEIFKKFGGSN